MLLSLGPMPLPSGSVVFVAGPDRHPLAAGIANLVRIVRQRIEAQSEFRELRLIERALSRKDGDVARRELRSGERSWIKRERQAAAGEARREAELARHRGVSRQSVEAARKRRCEQVRLDLCVVHRIAAANRETRVAAWMPPESETRLDVRFGVCQRLPVVSQSGVDGE